MNRSLLVLGLLLGLSACSIIPMGNDKPRERSVYLLDMPVETGKANPRESCVTVVINQPEAAPGFSGAGMLYTREPNRIERFAYSRWAASPAAMLSPMLLRSLRSTGDYKAVLSAPAAVVTDLRVELDDLRLLQVFSGGGSEVVMSVEVRVYAPLQRALLASQAFSYRVDADPNPVSGVRATEQAVASLLDDFVRLVGDAAAELPSGCDPG
ncbi:MAG: PqiC family protein [Gammaproteobacteria bacterium]|nr:PqiC family protein [Gammaproteobacteria bacterium]NND59852.1 hypothetical protein [Gammaproteobacteria bacterium]